MKSHTKKKLGCLLVSVGMFAMVATSLVGASKPVAKQALADGEVVLDDLITVGTTDSGSSGRKYSDDIIGLYSVVFNFPERIFSKVGYYINDHLDDAEQTDVKGDVIDFSEAIYINGESIAHWSKDVTPPVFPRTTGVVEFPVSAGGAHTPASVYIDSSGAKMRFRLLRDYFPLDSTVITFKKDVFRGYYNSTSYVLNSDVSFYATLSSTPKVSNSLAVDFVRSRNEDIFDYKITSINDTEKTAAGGANYHAYQMWTNIKRDDSFKDHSAFPVEYYVFMYDNILMNGKSLSYYADWGRGNSKDFTDLNDTSTQVPDYEMQHPTGSPNKKYDMVVQLSQTTDTTNIVLTVNVPDQLKTDFSIVGDPIFTLRNGSAWHTLNENNQSIIGRYDADYIDYAFDTIDGYEDELYKYRQAEQEQILTLLDNARTDITNCTKGANKVLSSLEEAIDALKTDEEYTYEERIGHVKDLINDIPANVTYTIECHAKIQKALDAYLNLTQEEKNDLGTDSPDLIDKMYEASATYENLDLTAYRSVVKDELNLKVKPDLYYDADKTAVEALVQTAKTAIDGASTKQQMDDALATLLTAVAGYKDAKTQANEELDNVSVAGRSSSEKAQIQAIIDQTRTQIDYCKDAKEVEYVLKRAKELIQGVKDGKDVDLTKLTIISNGIPTTTAILICAGVLVVSAGLTCLAWALVSKKKAKKSKE